MEELVKDEKVDKNAKAEKANDVYTVTDIVEDEEETEEVDYSTKTLAELKAIAKEKGIKGYSTMKKEDLVNALK